MSNNKSKIDKLKAIQADKVIEQSKLKVELGSEFVLSFTDLDELVKSSKKLSQYDKIIKLNEELTVENNRLISKLEKIDKERSIWHNYYNDLSANNKILTNQLQTIKSKWWYKLMMWEW